MSFQMHVSCFEIALQVVRQHFMPLFLYENCLMHHEFVFAALNNLIDPESLDLLSPFPHNFKRIIWCERISLQLETRA
jgi:hypothetical protein